MAVSTIPKSFDITASNHTITVSSVSANSAKTGDLVVDIPTGYTFFAILPQYPSTGLIVGQWVVNADTGRLALYVSVRNMTSTQTNIDANVKVLWIKK